MQLQRRRNANYMKTLVRSGHIVEPDILHELNNKSLERENFANANQINVSRQQRQKLKFHSPAK